MITRRDQRSKADFFAKEAKEAKAKKAAAPAEEGSDDEYQEDGEECGVDPDAEDEEGEEEEEEDEYEDEDEYDYEGRLCALFTYTLAQ